MKVQVFVSYCHSDISPDDKRLKVLVNALESAGGGLYEIIVDYRNDDAAIGASLREFMGKIDSTDAVVILLTPGYKTRVAQKGSTGVYSEFRRIYDRLLESEEKRVYGRNYLILPLIFSGSFEESCPPELRNSICGDLTWLYVKPKSVSPALRRDMKIRLDQVAAEIINRMAAIASTKRAVFREQEEQIFRLFLFQDTKSRWDKPESSRYLDSVFVKTSTFLRLRDREVSFVVGRKGAGKSTLTHVLPILAVPRPEIVLRLEFEQVPFEMCFNILKSNPAEASDITRAFSPIYSYQLLWDAFLHIFFAWNLRDRLPRSSQLRRLLKRMVDDVTATAKEPAEVLIMVTKILFVFSFEQLVRFVDSLMKSSSPGFEFLPTAVGRFAPGAFREYILGRSGWDAVQSLISKYRDAGGRVLVTADGFDTMVGYFLRSDQDPGPAEFEKELLLSLFQIILNKGPASVAGGKLYELADFCIAIPHDRFLRVRSIDHDRYQYRHRFARIEWSGIELSALVRKRLSLLRNISDQPGLPLEERLRNVMRSGYPELPDEVVFQFGAALYRLPLFCYVLRHTFWRPRDVLFYYAALLAASDQFRRKRKEMPSGFVRQVIAGATRIIVEDEFIEEFSSSLRNLREVLSAFRHSGQVLGWAQLAGRLEKLRFDTMLPDAEKADLQWKVERLYEIGALGVVLDRKTSERLSAYRHAFSFNEGDILVEKIGRDSYSSYQYILHPVLCEYLHLDTADNSELILPLDWKYLHDNEILRGIAPA